MCVYDGEGVWCEALALVLGPFVFHAPLSQVHPSVFMSRPLNCFQNVCLEKVRVLPHATTLLAKARTHLCLHTNKEL